MPLLFDDGAGITGILMESGTPDRRLLAAVFAVLGGLMLAGSTALLDRAEAASLADPNPWVVRSVYPMSHYNPAQTDVTHVVGPSAGSKLTVEDARTVPVAWVSGPTVKRIGEDTVVIASNPLGIIKVRATGESFDVISNVPYPHMEEVHAEVSDETIARVMRGIDGNRRKKQGWRLWLRSLMMYSRLNLGQRTMGSGAYAVIDKDGFHYTAFDKTWMVKSFDHNRVDQPMAPVRSMNLMDALPEDATDGIDRILGINMTYDGYLVAAATGGLFVMDRDLTVQDRILFPGEHVENSIAIDHQNGIYVVTSKQMHKLVWTGRELSQRAEDGAWVSPYATMPEGESYKMGALSIGSGTTPTLMGFGEDEDKLVIISDASREGANIVAFWREQIPDDFEQKAGALSRRIADQQPIRISRATVEASPAVYGYGVVLINSTYPEPSPISMDAIGNALMSGITRKAPLGVQKFIWNARDDRFEESRLLPDIDNTDWMPPAISPASGMTYIANKREGINEYVGVDWETGEIKARWEFPDEGVIWNNWGGITTLLDDGDFLLGGFFAFKRYDVRRD
jgi:hypothetical protein